MTYDIDSFEKFYVIGDRVLLKPRKEENKTRAGLYLPPGVKEKEKIQSGFVIKIGPGYPIPSAEDESWKSSEEHPKYLPLQVKEGDLAIYLQSQTFEIEFNREKYLILPQAAILMVIREEDIFD